MPIVLPKLPDPDLDETSPYCVIAKHRAKPGKADAYERRMLADLANTRAEPGALQFHIHRDRSDPDLFVIYEVWRDVQAFREHFEQPYGIHSRRHGSAVACDGERIRCRTATVAVHAMRSWSLVESAGSVNA